MCCLLIRCCCPCTDRHTRSLDPPRGRGCTSTRRGSIHRHHQTKEQGCRFHFSGSSRVGVFTSTCWKDERKTPTSLCPCVETSMSRRFFRSHVRLMVGQGWRRMAVAFAVTINDHLRHLITQMGEIQAWSIYYDSRNGCARLFGTFQRSCRMSRELREILS